MYGGIAVSAYCKDWDGSGFKWCFLDGGFGAAECPDAQKASSGDYYWTKSPAVCGGKNEELKRTSCINKLVVLKKDIML